ncbi:MAG: hypothetical protein RLZZ176_2348, partial [Cyanobacteriota bacterium]
LGEGISQQIAAKLATKSLIQPL